MGRIYDVDDQNWDVEFISDGGSTAVADQPDVIDVDEAASPHDQALELWANCQGRLDAAKEDLARNASGSGSQEALNAHFAEADQLVKEIGGLASLIERQWDELQSLEMEIDSQDLRNEDVVVRMVQEIPDFPGKSRILQLQEDLDTARSKVFVKAEEFEEAFPDNEDGFYQRLQDPANSES